MGVGQGFHPAAQTIAGPAVLMSLRWPGNITARPALCSTRCLTNASPPYPCPPCSPTHSPPELTCSPPVPARPQLHLCWCCTPSMAPHCSWDKAKSPTDWGLGVSTG